MPYARTKAARLREFRRLGNLIRKAERDLELAIEARSQLLLDDHQALDRSTSDEIAQASGVTGSAVRNALKRLRERL